MDVQISFPLAFVAGLVSFLSPCVLPVVPSYVAFVSGMTLEELRDGSAPKARRTAVLHSVLFVVGFSAVFMTLGLVATSIGTPIARALPWLARLGGVILILLGLYMIGWLPLGWLARDLRPRLSGAAAGPMGSVVVGMAFGAGWTPCIGPILASILLYTSLESTMLEGVGLLGVYALGLGVPFVAASSALNVFLAGTAKAGRWLVPLQRAAGAVLVLVGILMVTGRFAALTGVLAGMGQLIDLEMP
ncbi:MAG: cytochrome c biogenesis protein CcdA [Gemmatimonadota bacterium]